MNIEIFLESLREMNRCNKNSQEASTVVGAFVTTVLNMTLWYFLSAYFPRNHKLISFETVFFTATILLWIVALAVGWKLHEKFKEKIWCRQCR